MITTKQLVDYAKAMLGKQYWYGTYGQAATEALLKAKSKQYPKYYNPDNYKKGWECNGEPVFDCCGLIKAAVWSKANPANTPVYNSNEDRSANGMYEAATEKGSISTLPNIPGIILWKNGHVAISLGDGKRCIEAKGHDAGVVISNIKDRPFTNWFKCDLIEYPKENTINVTIIVDGKTYNGNISEV